MYSFKISSISSNDYLALVAPGYETPAIQSHIITSHPTGVVTASHLGEHYAWSAPTGDANLWQNVEFHKYGNNLMESHHYVTPAHLTTSQSEIVVHAPSDSTLQIIKEVPQVQSINFLGVKDKKASASNLKKKHHLK